MGYDLVVQALLENAPVDLSNLPSDQRKNFDDSAEDLRERNFYLEAAKIFSMTGNREKLLDLGRDCLKNKNLGVAFFAFNAAKEKGGLNKTGEEFLKVPDVKAALSCFEAAENVMMVSFLKENF